MSLVNTREMFQKAYDGGYAVGAPAREAIKELVEHKITRVSSAVW